MLPGALTPLLNCKGAKMCLWIDSSSLSCYREALATAFTVFTHRIGYTEVGQIEGKNPCTVHLDEETRKTHA